MPYSDAAFSGGQRDPDRAERLKVRTECRPAPPPQALQAIAAHLTLPPGAAEDLDSAIRRVAEKRELSGNAITHLASIDEELAYALSDPIPLHPGSLDDGGWDFEEVDSRLSRLRRHAATAHDRELQNIVDAKRTEVQTHQGTAEIIMAKVRALLTAIQAEDFPRVLSALDELELLWKQVRAQEPGWDGLGADPLALLIPHAGLR